MKKGLRITLWILAALLLLLLAGLVAVQSPRVQTALARKAVSAFSGNLDGDIQVGRISVKPFDALVLQDVVLTDRHPYSDGSFVPRDTVLRVGTLSARFSLKGLLRKERISVSRLRLEDGVFNLVLEPGTVNSTRVSLLRVLGIPEEASEKQQTEDFGDLLEAKRIDVENMTFRMVNYAGAEAMRRKGVSLPDNVIDWNDLEINTDIQARNLLVKDGVISGEVEHMRISDKTGWNVPHISGKTEVGHGKVLVDNLHIQDTDSDLHLSHFRMLGSLSDDYGDFLERVRLEGEFLPGSVFSMKTVSHFAPNLEHFSFQADLTGKVEGTVSRFNIKDLTFREKASGVSGIVNGSMTGLPEINTTLLDFKARDLRFNLDGLGTFINEWAPDSNLDLSQFGKGTGFHMDATVNGTLNRLAVNGALGSNAGTADVSLTLRNLVDRNKDISLGGILETHALDVGRIAGIEAVGPVSLKTGLEATLAPGRLQARIDSLDISSLRALGYDYTGIAAVGLYEDDAFDGRIVCDDPNLSFLLQGKFDLSPKKRNAAYQFYANIGYADLHALNIDKRGPSKVSLLADADFIRTQDRDLLGEVNLRDIMLENAAGHHRIGDITASAHTNDDIHRIRLESGFAEGSFVGEKSIVSLVSDLKELIVKKELPSLLPQEGKPWDGTPYEVNFKFHDAQPLLTFLLPGLYVEKNTALNLKVSEDGTVKGTATSGRVALGGKYLKDFRLNLDNLDGALHAGLTGSAIKLGSLELLDNRLSLSADDDRFALDYRFDNGTETANKADVRIEGALSRSPEGLRLQANAQPSSIYYDGNRWDLQSGDIVLDGGDLRVDRFRLYSKDQTLTANGGISGGRTDTLTVRMDRFDISLLNSLLMEGKMDLKGRATGQANLISPTKPSLGLLAGITCDSTYVAGRPLGRLQVGSVWNEEEEGFNLRLRNQLAGKENILFTGFVRPKDKTVRAEATLDGFDLGYAAPLLSGIFDRFGGGLDGKVRVGGTLDKLRIGSEGMQLVDGVLGIDFTQVAYHVSGPISVDTEGLHFNGVTLSDGLDGKGSVTGSLLLGGFKNLRMDTHVQFDRTKVLDITADRQGPIFGTVFGTGRVDITGPFNALTLNVDARTVKDGDLHIPLKSATTRATGDLLVFKEPFEEKELDPYEAMMNSGVVKAPSQSDLDIRVKVRATPAVTAHVDIGEGNSLRGMGSGLIDLRVRESQKLFTINGDYTLNQGDFRFSALNLVSREFTIQDGSSIRFNGDIMDSDLNVSGIYSTKASLSTLLSTSSSATSEGSLSRREVDCLIGITDKLRNPKITLDIDIPELDPGTQGQVESALNTEDKVMKQFLYLLIAGSFLPNEESGIITTGTSNMLYSNMTGIMAGQLNSIFEKLDIPLDLGLNYQQNESGNDLFDVALSTQLFNNRVIVNGTIGNRRLYGTTTEEVTGDLDIDIKLDKPGTIRLNLFSHSADQYTSYLDNSQRNGIGLAYQREFNSLRQFFRDLFKPRAEREERLPDETASRRVLQIDSTGRAHSLLPHE